MYGAEAAPWMADQSWFSSTITKTVLMWLLTVMRTADEEVAAPAASIALTATAWSPFGTEKLSQLSMNGAAAALATTAPSARKATRAVPAGAEGGGESGPR